MSQHIIRWWPVIWTGLTILAMTIFGHERGFIPLFILGVLLLIFWPALSGRRR